MPPSSHDAHQHPERRTGFTPDIDTDVAGSASRLLNCQPSPFARTSQPLHVDGTAYDTVREREVQLVVRPGVYDVAKWWVRPSSGGGGWLAAPDELELQEADDHAE